MKCKNNASGKNGGVNQYKILLALSPTWSLICKIEIFNLLASWETAT